MTIDCLKQNFATLKFSLALLPPNKNDAGAATYNIMWYKKHICILKYKENIRNLRKLENFGNK